MSIQIKRVVTAVDVDGKSVIQEDAPLAPVNIELMPKTDAYQVWGTEGEIVAPGHEPVEGATHSFFPGPGGTRLGVITFPPQQRDAPPPPAPDAETMEKLVAEAETKLPGLLEPFEPDAPGFHTTRSVDYDIVLQGELTLELDDGAEATLPAGTCVIQNGTRHAWRNYGNEVAVLAYVIVAAPRAL